MAEIKTGTIDPFVEHVANSIRVQLEKAGIHVQRIILFGSYARGTQTDVSDIDLAVVSKSFSGTRFYDITRIVDVTTLPDSRIEIHPFRPEDFTEANPFALEILNTGVVVFEE